MRDKIYLLSVEELLPGMYREETFQGAAAWLDDTRRGKLEHLGQKEAKAASIGAGLLLQKAAADWEDLEEGRGGGPDKATEYSSQVQEYGVSQLLEELAGQRKKPIQLSYVYGPGGKPFFRDFPLFFSLSHSGGYVLCAVSGRETGADIQKVQSVDTGKLAARFFAAEECEILGQCRTAQESQHCFYRLWTRKEALGKLTGRGVAEVLGQNVWQDGDCIWLELSCPPGYQGAVCTWK